MADFFYRPQGAWAADFIPFYDADHPDGRYRLFYLQDWRDPANHGEGTPWFQISTGDFVHFRDHGQMLARGGVDAQDLYVFTGSVIRALGQYHIFYTGHNPHLRKAGRPEQAVMHAVSDDLVTWRKLPEHTFFAPDDRYEPHDWRDPFVFFNDEAGEYWMLLAARLTTGPSRRRGCTALCASRDLVTWEVREPFWSPGLYFTHECPDLFRMGEWWYLVFSEFSERCVTRYRMSRTLAGPWLAPADDTFDGRAFYAAKTASDGVRRLVFGWNPTRAGAADDGAWQWGGNLVVHELAQRADGSLTVAPPGGVAAAFATPQPITWAPALGAASISERGVVIAAPHGFGCALAGQLPERCKLTLSLAASAGTQSFGLVLRSDDALEGAYYVRLEPARQRVVFDRWPRPGDQPHMAELERPVSIAPDAPMQVTVFIDGSLCEVYLDGAVAMSARMYAHAAGAWGVFVSEGSVTVSAAALHTLA